MKKIITLMLFGFFLSSSAVRAESYAFYVDDSCADERDGSESKPFCDIADALEKAGNGDKIYIRDGAYNENVKLPKGVSLRGKSESGVVISGYVEMDDGSKLENLTISGSSINVRIKKDADAEIDDCTIKEAKRVGIQTEIGGGKLKVKNSKIRDGGKGLYIQSGKSIEMTGNEIYDNNEEGLDIRANVSGQISNNTIYSNGESGIELIVGKSEIAIRSNSIKGNGASGIANQFYAQWAKEGNISIIGNTLSSNRKFGIDCGIPGKGGDQMSAGYWSDSIALRKNKLDKNSKGSINEMCSLIKVVEEEEKKDNEILEEETVSESLSEREGVVPGETSQESLTGEEVSEVDQEIQERVGVIRDEFQVEKASWEDIAKELKERSFFGTFLWGSDPKKLEQLADFSQRNKEREKELEKILEETGNPDLVEKVANLREEIERGGESLDQSLEGIQSRASLFGWARRLIYRLF